MERSLIKAMLVADEGLRLKPYKDSLGQLTIGIGRCLSAKGITTKEAVYLLDNDIDEVIDGLDKEWPFWRELSERRQMALINMGFQLGVGGLIKFKTALHLLRLGAYESAALELLKSKWHEQTPVRAKRVANMIREG